MYEPCAGWGSAAAPGSQCDGRAARMVITERGLVIRWGLALACSIAIAGCAEDPDEGGGASGAGGAGGDDDPGECIYHGMANSGAAGAPTGQGVTVKTSPTLGPYLAGSDGRPLYIYGTDYAGNCRRVPESACTADCSLAWPNFFDAATPVAPGLNLEAFGSVLDENQQPITTYYGWPLHVYKSDTYDAATTVWTTTGQGKGKTWHLARPVPYNLLIAKANSGAVTHIVGGEGMTLYTFAKDTVGATPVSACTGACRAAFPPYVQSSVIPVGSLLAADFSLFARPDNGKLQVAFRGAPLYESVADSRPGDLLGANTADWVVVTP